MNKNLNTNETVNEATNPACFLGAVACCGFSVGDKVVTPYSEGEVWKVTEKSVHVKHWDSKREMWMFSKYLTEPYHHSQNPVSLLSHCR